MRSLKIALLLAALGAGAAQAQPLSPSPALGADPFLATPSFGADPLLQHRFQMEVQRLEADQRSLSAAQFRLQGELATRQLQSIVESEVVVGPSPDETAPYRVQGGSPAEARARAERLRQQRVERSMKDMRAAPRR